GGRVQAGQEVPARCHQLAGRHRLLPRLRRRSALRPRPADAVLPQQQGEGQREEELTNHRGTEDTEKTTTEERRERHQSIFVFIALCLSCSVISVTLWFVLFLRSPRAAVACQVRRGTAAGRWGRTRAPCSDPGRRF